MKILNLTQHKSTPAQKDAGVIDMKKDSNSLLIELLTFDEIPKPNEIHERAKNIAEIAAKEGGYTHAMIGGAPFLMSNLEKSLLIKGIKPIYAFSKRCSVEEQQDDGTVSKRSIFRFLGFVEAT